MTSPANNQLETRVIEVLDAIREVINRLATLEEKTVWHNNVMNQLSSNLKETADRVSDHDRDRGRIALLERDFQYLSGEVSKISKQTEVITGITAELQRSDFAQTKSVGFIENFGSQVVLAFLSAGGGAVAMKLLGQ